MPTAREKLEAIMANRDVALSTTPGYGTEVSDEDKAAHRQRVAMRQARDKGEAVASAASGSLKDRARKKLGMDSAEPAPDPKRDEKVYQTAQQRYLMKLAQIGHTEGILTDREGLRTIEQKMIPQERRLSMWQDSVAEAEAEGVDSPAEPQYIGPKASQPQQNQDYNQRLRQMAADKFRTSQLARAAGSAPVSRGGGNPMAGRPVAQNPFIQPAQGGSPVPMMNQMNGMPMQPPRQMMTVPRPELSIPNPNIVPIDGRGQQPMIPINQRVPY